MRDPYINSLYLIKINSIYVITYKILLKYFLLKLRVLSLTRESYLKENRWKRIEEKEGIHRCKKGTARS